MVDQGAFNQFYEKEVKGKPISRVRGTRVVMLGKRQRVAPGGSLPPHARARIAHQLANTRAASCPCPNPALFHPCRRNGTP